MFLLLRNGWWRGLLERLLGGLFRDHSLHYLVFSLVQSELGGRGGCQFTNFFSPSVHLTAAGQLHVIVVVGVHVGR